jgi:hypothetical protein
MTRECVQVGPNTWRWITVRPPPAASDLPRPFVISDTMEPTEQVDGRFYTSKRAFRAVGRALGLTEVGNEKPKPKVRATALRSTKEARRRSIKTAIEKYQAGQRPTRQHTGIS